VRRSPGASCRRAGRRPGRNARWSQSPTRVVQFKRRNRMNWWPKTVER
jgi:hypothetical protein